MAKIAHEKKEIENCFKSLQNNSQNSNGQSIKNSFSRFPNGFFINNEIDSDSFFHNTIKEPSKKDKLSYLISSNQFIKKLSTSPFDLSINYSIFEPNENIFAIKLVNESIILWTENNVYKIPVSDKALKRIENAEENINQIKNLEEELQSFFQISKFIKTPKTIIQVSKKCETLSLNKRNISSIDNFLQNYFNTVFKFSKKQDSIYRGFQHGDLHFRNILKDTNGNLILTDLDLIKTSGFPFLDLMHFAIHVIRTLEQTSQYKPLELFLNEKSYLYDKLKSYQFNDLSKIWLKYYHENYISLYIQSQIEWYHYNKVVSNELSELQNLQKKYNL